MLMFPCNLHADYEVQATKRELAQAILEQSKLGRVPTMITGVTPMGDQPYFTGGCRRHAANCRMVLVRCLGCDILSVVGWA